MKLMKYQDFILEAKQQVNMPLPTDVLRIAKAYHQVGKDLYVVGGACRDFLQGKTPHDYDLVTDALPEESKNILKGWNVSDEQGKNFGVLRVYTKDEPQGYEIAVYRKDISKGRNVKGDDEKVEIGKHITIEDDVRRRDITINAIFYDINKKEIIDLVGGINDLKHNIIRCVGDPHQRFDEDRLRILRAFRFAARMGAELDPGTAKAISEDNRLRGINPQEDVKQERIWEEWNKMREQATPETMRRYMDLLSEFDMWEQMFPGLDISEDFPVDYLDNAILFFDLFHENPLPKTMTGMRKLKFPLDVMGEVEYLREFETKWEDMEENVYELARKLMRKNIKPELIRRFTDHTSDVDPKFVIDFLEYCADGFVIDGNDLLRQGFTGKAIEFEKKRLETERFMTAYWGEE